MAEPSDTNPHALTQTLHDYIYATAPIFKKENPLQAEATGFWLYGEQFSLFITCKHVFENEKEEFLEWAPESIWAIVHQKVDSQYTNDIMTFALEYDNCFPLGDLDLVAFRALTRYFIAPNKPKAKPGFICFPRNMIKSIKELVDQKMARVFSTVALVGYPLGLYDNVNYLPVPRTGIVASPVSVHWKGNPNVGIHATPCYPGDSGAPVIAYDHRYVLLGIHTSGYDSDHNLLQNKEETPYVPLPVGSYIHAHAMLKEIESIPELNPEKQK